MTDEQPTSRRAARESGSSGRTPRAPREPRAPRAPRAERPPRVPKVDRTTVLPAVGPDGQPLPDQAPPKGGILTAIRKHPTAWLLSTAAVVFVLLGTGAVFAGVAFASGRAPAPAPTHSVAPPRPQPATQAAATQLRTCTIAGLAADPRLMALSGSVMRADTGEVLFDRGAAVPTRTGSVLKVLTSSAAIAALTPDFQITTQVFKGGADGTIVLVGHGDATLSATPPGSESVYTGAPKLADLAQQTLANYTGEPITTVVLDASYWNPADKWDASWKRSEQTIGYQSEVTALQVDGDRANPGKETSPRGTDPITTAGQKFLQALRDADTDHKLADDVSLTTGSSTGGTVLATVKSQPLRVLIKQMLSVSDNTLAEMLARITSKESGFDGSAKSLQQAIPSALWPQDAATARSVVIIDGSGESANDGVPAVVMANFMRQVQAGANNLDVVRDALPVAGKSGTLSGRFTGNNAVARGNIIAKTGWIDTAYTLSGIVNAADGTVLTFAFYAVGDGIKDNAKDALDTLATGVFNCGNNLANN